MNILHIHEQLEERGGTEKHITRLRELFEREGFFTYLLVVRPILSNHFYWNAGESVSSDLIQPFNCLGQKTNGILNQIKPDVILVHGVSFPAFIETLFQQATCPIFRYMHDPRMVCPGHGKFWYRSEACCQKPVGRHCLLHTYTEICAPRNPLKLISRFKNTYFEIHKGSKHYSKIIVASDYMRKEAILAGLPSKKIVKIAPPIDINLKPFEPIPSELTRILFVGRMSRTKGPHLLIRILAPLLLENANWQVDFVGDGLIKDKCIKLAYQYGISEQTHFHGWKSTSEIETFYQQCSLVVFPTIYPEAFGNIGLEAFRSGRLVVGFNVGGVSEWLKEGVNGRLIEPGDEQGFARAIQELLSDRPSLNQMSLKAQEYVNQSFSPNITIAKYKTIFCGN